MGFLNNTTNNVILDAVLTDTGRALLARNDGSFRIASVSFFDDEVDYGIITKYGNTVGDEKIIKNTSISEAVTNPSLSAKHALVTTRARNIQYLPILVTDTPSLTLSTSTTNENSNRSGYVVVMQRMPANATTTVVDNSLINTSYEVVVNDNFLSISNQESPVFVDSFSMATYLISQSTNTQTSNIAPNASSTLSFNVSLRRLTDSQFLVYGSGGVIKTTVRIKGKQSGSTLDIPVTITKS